MNKIPKTMIELIDSTVSSVIEQSFIPGLSIAVLYEDDLVFNKGYGLRNLEDKLPSTIDTLYSLGSCTKSFTALAIMQLVEKNKLNLNDPVSNYIPFELGSRNNPITIHHLLSHSSGVPNLNVALIILGIKLGLVDFGIQLTNREDFFAYINQCSEEIVEKPGKKMLYFNSGYIMLGYIIEKVSGMKYEDYINTNILKPLEMKRSTFIKEAVERDEDTITSYYSGFKNGQQITKKIDLLFDDLVSAGGGLFSSSKELINYLKLYLNGGIFEGTRLLNNELLNEMLKIHVKRSSTLHEGETGYGYGWEVFEDIFGEKVIMHGGSSPFIGALMIFIPKKKIAIALTINSGDINTILMLGSILACILLGKNPRDEIPYFHISQRLNMLMGEYETHKGLQKLRITKKGALLYYQLQSPVDFIDLPSEPLIPESIKHENLKFYTLTELGTKRIVEFKLKRNGDVDLIIPPDVFHKKIS
jgi:CubicO group peptidase (beta-lactamase class C family)